ncbi:glutathione S-transferase family protein [Pseudomonadales bacterium]|jgi:glutathione S-transferase|nr:glutathione S-transferase family protein [Pseudomonadales bacterium]MDB4807071.1 glutathione S-transferase family protein [Pseudomonadales bacterium]
MITLYGASASPFVRKVLAVLAIKQLPFEHIQQMPFANDAEFKKISPLGKIPALKDGDITVCDSTVICEFLEDSYPNPAVYPIDPADKARARWLEDLGDTKVAELASGIFFQRFMRPMVLQQATDEALVEKIITQQLPPCLDYIETQVPAEGFIFEDFGAADIGLISSFINASYAGYEVDAARWPLLASFIQRVKSHPAISPLLTTEAQMLGLAQ